MAVTEHRYQGKVVHGEGTMPGCSCGWTGYPVCKYASQALAVWRKHYKGASDAT